MGVLSRGLGTPKRWRQNKTPENITNVHLYLAFYICGVINPHILMSTFLLDNAAEHLCYLQFSLYIQYLIFISGYIYTFPTSFVDLQVLVGFVLLDLLFYIHVYVLQIVVCPFVLFLLAIVLSVLLRYTDSDCPFDIFKLFLNAIGGFISAVVIRRGHMPFCKTTRTNIVNALIYGLYLLLKKYFKYDHYLILTTNICLF